MNNKKNDELGPIEVKVYDGSKESLEIAIRKLNRMVKKEGILQEYMWRRYKRDKREKKPKYFKWFFILNALITLEYIYFGVEQYAQVLSNVNCPEKTFRKVVNVLKKDDSWENLETKDPVYNDYYQTVHHLRYYAARNKNCPRDILRELVCDRISEIRTIAKRTRSSQIRNGTYSTPADCSISANKV